MPDFYDFTKIVAENFKSKTLAVANAHNALLPESRKNLPEGDVSKATPSAVLLLIYPDKNFLPNTVFIKRNDYKGHHNKQISLPGGKREKEDKDLADTAIRETFEEIGVKCKKENIGFSLILRCI